MAKYGRFEGGTHFKKLDKRKINLGPTNQQRKRMKELGINYKGKLTFVVAKKLIKDKIKANSTSPLVKDNSNNGE